mgnify:CR=1 FL=1
MDGWHDINAFAEARELPAIVVYRWEAPLFFANAGAFRRQIRELARREGTRWLVLQCEAITDIDVTAAGVLEQLDNELDAAGVHILFVELRTRLHDLIDRYGLYATLDRSHFFESIHEALVHVEGAKQAEPDPSGEPPEV